MGLKTGNIFRIPKPILEDEKILNNTIDLINAYHGQKEFIELFNSLIIHWYNITNTKTFEKACKEDMFRIRNKINNILRKKGKNILRKKGKNILRKKGNNMDIFYNICMYMLPFIIRFR